MAIRVEHEIHRRRLGRNLGLALVLLGFVAVVFGLTVVKILNLGDVDAFEGYDHVAQRPNSVAAAPAEGGGD